MQPNIASRNGGRYFFSNSAHFPRVGYKRATAPAAVAAGARTRCPRAAHTPMKLRSVSGIDAASKHVAASGFAAPQKARRPLVPAVVIRLGCLPVRRLEPSLPDCCLRASWRVAQASPSAPVSSPPPSSMMSLMFSNK
eukprot:GHVT01098357.1.p1 GENE.GHVT01098357.1~~GHVT01098357.1.p1  ORF type:complete len:138 (+),score=26.39 GHVT01098357.1:74-487(+)